MKHFRLWLPLLVVVVASGLSFYYLKAPVHSIVRDFTVDLPPTPQAPCATRRALRSGPRCGWGLATGKG